MSALDDAIALVQGNAAPPPDPNAPDLSLGAGVPVPQLSDADKLNQAVLDAQRAAALTGVDTSGSAPIAVRAAVGSVDAKDRLPTLQKYYPDAAAVPGTDNFVYTNPQTGKPSIYAPMGWRVPGVGDVASVAPEVGEGVGAVAGSLAGTYLGGPGAGTLLGGGAGAAVGKDLVRRGISLLTPTVDTRTPDQVGMDDATTFAVNAMLPWLGERVGGPILHALLRPDPTATATAARNLGSSTGVDVAGNLPGGVIGESPSAQKIEKYTGQAVFSGGVPEKYAAGVTAMDDAADVLTQRAAAGGPPPSPDSFASSVNDVAKNINSRWETNRAALDQNIENQIGASTQVNLNRLRALRGQYVSDMAVAPETLSAQYQPAIDAIDKLLADSEQYGGTLPFSAVRSARTNLGTQIGWNQNTTATDAIGQPMLKQVYGGLQSIIQNAATNAGPAALRALQDHDATVAAYRFAGGPADTLTKLMSPTLAPNAITTMAQSSRPADQMGLATLMSPTFSDAAERATIRSGVMAQMGAKPSYDGGPTGFDMPTWLSNWNKMSPRARDTLFDPAGSGGLQDDLANLAAVQNQFQQAAGYKNFPNTGPFMQFMGTLGPSLAALFTGHPMVAASTMASGWAGPSAIGMAMTSKPFVRWMSGAYGINQGNAAQLGEYLGRLGAVGEADPRLQDFVSKLRASVSAGTPAQ